MKLYIAGKITGNENFVEDFKKAENYLKEKGHTVLNPAILPYGFSWDEYMVVCLSMILICDGIYLLDNWRESKGACMEVGYAREKNKKILTGEI